MSYAGSHRRVVDRKWQNVVSLLWTTPDVVHTYGDCAGGVRHQRGPSAPKGRTAPVLRSCWRLRRRSHVHGDWGGHVGMQADLQLDRAQLFEWLVEGDPAAVDLDAELREDRVGDVGAGDRA